MNFKKLLASTGKELVKKFGKEIESKVIEAIDREGDKGQEALKHAVVKAIDKAGK